MSAACGGLGSGVRDLAGRFLHDHLSFRMARVHIRDHSGFQRLFAPIFVGETMRSLRMELSSDFLSQENLPALYAHFLFRASAASGFAVVRDVLRGLQRGHVRSALSEAARLPAAIPEIAALLAERYLRRRLLFPEQGRGLSTVRFRNRRRAEISECMWITMRHPSAASCTSLGISAAIRCGSRAAFQQAIAHFWSSNNLDRIAHLEFAGFEHEAGLQPDNVHDLYHPAGTVRMSLDSAQGVVDADLRVHGTSNAYVARIRRFFHQSEQPIRPSPPWLSACGWRGSLTKR